MAERFRKQQTDYYLGKVRTLTAKMPAYAKGYIDSCSDTMEIRSRYEYARDLMLFFRFLKDELPELEHTDIKDIPLSVIDELSPDTLDSYKEFLTKYTSFECPGLECENSNTGKHRKLAVLRSFYKHLNRRKLVSSNPAGIITMPKKHKNVIITMKPDEETKLLLQMDTRSGKTRKQLELYERNRIRDRLIVLLFLGTGLRISELAGLDVEDIDLNEMTATIIRKGGDQDKVYFSPQIRQVFREYLSHTKVNGTRLSFNPKKDEHALFLTVKGTRYSIRAIQDMIKTNVRNTFGKDTKLSPHKMRASFATNLYSEKKDMQLVQQALHHKSVATTEKFYLGFDEERKKKAARTIAEPEYIKINQENE